MEAAPPPEGLTSRGQGEVIAFLASPATHAGSAVRRVETHASIVFLAGARAYKLKRAVKYDYLDYSTVEQRRAFCEAELRINARVAPAIYRRVVAVTREPEGHLAIGGAGIPVDWLVEMTRFDEERLLDHLAASDRLELSLMRPLAAALAAFHAGAERRFDHGGAASLAWVIDGNAAAFREQAAGVLDPVLCTTVTSLSRNALDGCRTLLDARRAAGRVRQCHGDAHLGNIVSIDGVPTLFDAIEFNDELACIDVFYDLAFPLMDLWFRRLPRHANALLNGYLASTGDFEGLALLPLFLGARAAIRAKTSLSASLLATAHLRRQQLAQTARDYLAEAADLLRPARPSLIAIGGLSGTGKSTLALSLAPSVGAVPGAVLLRSDEVRKRLCGVPELARLGPNGYTAEVSGAVYETLIAHAATSVRAGHTAIIDAVFLNPGDRSAAEEAARHAGVPFAGLWLEAPEPVLLDRVQRRIPDASDADATIVRLQAGRDAGTIRWMKMDATGDADTVHDAARHLLRSALEEGVRQAA